MTTFKFNAGDIIADVEFPAVKWQVHMLLIEHETNTRMYYLRQCSTGFYELMDASTLERFFSKEE